MMPNNGTKVRDHLDFVRRRKPKFICINDDVKDPHVDPSLQVHRQPASQAYVANLYV